ncbi:MAG: bifunctional diaminohydroxyphosphoribosylaminopyrimidine deaminase/5-amino-6-(5-phosphoribosylamino)uracil reductase RibD [Actinobacteria bacterium]|nr:bifunctional diaminohydroxyphosphoribosylaminopyrimidine deaminase/5-amino-6-(5-phosphoribosylamino)uracil reductase RibD [Actinomycetota bacterium]
MQKDKDNNFYRTAHNSDFSTEDIKFMKLAVKLAGRAKGMTNPNPLVGAVIVKNGNIIATGYHKIFGGPHAEIEAINAVENKKILNGAKIYVTLEPCSITGKTPPCVDSLIKYGFSEVIIGSVDPNPMVNSSGIKKLQSAKIKVRAGLLKDIIARQNEIFFKHIKTKRPFICCKIAASIDGKVAAKTSNSKWITGETSRKTVQDIRREFECILTGINTVTADNPYLYPRKESTVKPLLEKNRKFYRAVLDLNLKISPYSNIVKTAREVKTLIFTADDILAKTKLLSEKGVELISVGRINSVKLDIKEVLKILYDRYKITSILVESGPTLLTELLRENLVDKFYFFIAPKIIGGDSIYNIFSELNISNVNEAIKLKFEKIKKIGEDILITAYPVSYYNCSNDNYRHNYNNEYKIH